MEAALVISMFPACGMTDFTKLADRKRPVSIPSPGMAGGGQGNGIDGGGAETGSPQGRDAVSSSTNRSHKGDDLSPKLNPLAGAAFIKPPEINNYGSVGLTYPIDVPPGRHGIQPGVGLSYSSSGGDGLVGMGWSLGTGLGVISRTTVNGQLYYDERDFFTFNGKRLIKVDGPPGSENGTYRLEIGPDFSRFELSDAGSGGIWRRYDNSGIVTVFGEDLSSRIYQPANNIKTYLWNFTRSYDLNGNNMEAVYDVTDYGADHVLFVSEIRYTGNYHEGMPAKQYVKFTYRERDEAYVSKSPGFIMRMKRLLDSIEVGWNGNSLWQYNMVYGISEDSGRVLLKSVQSTRTVTDPEFLYQPAEHLFVWQKVNNPWYNDPESNPDAIKYFEGDFNGDGISDMVFFNPGTGDWKGAEGRREGGYNYRNYGNRFKGYDSSWKIQFFKGNATGDYNGDGRSDIAFYLPETREFQVTEHDGRVFRFRRYGGLPPTDVDIFKCQWFTGDFDGNGLSDAVLFNEPTGEWILMRNRGGYFDFIKFSTHFKNLFRGDYAPDSNMDSPFTSDSSDYGKAREKINFLSGDFNGDGRTDISLYDARDGKWWVAENYRDDASAPPGTGTDFRLEWRLFKIFTVPEQVLFGHDRFSGDFNGDGFSDFLLFDRSKGEWILGETGDGTIKFRTYSKIPGSLDVTRWLQGDFNGDGRTDIGFFSKTDNNFWIGEAAPDGFRYRIYNNMSYGPDPSRVMETPLPRDEVKIDTKRTVIGGTTTIVADCQYDANYHMRRGEMVFPGFYTVKGGPVPEFLIWKRPDNSFYWKSGNGNPSEIRAFSGIDFEDAHTRLLTRERGNKYFDQDGILYYNKTSLVFGNTHSFRLLCYNGGSFKNINMASFNDGSGAADIENFNIDESLYLIDDFNKDGSKEVLVLDDQRSDARFILFNINGSVERTYAVSAPAGLDFNNLFRAGTSGGDRGKRGLYRFFSGRFTADTGEPAQILMVDTTGGRHAWYLGSINGNDINFELLAGNPILGFEDAPNSSAYRVTDGHLIYHKCLSGQVRFYRVEISGIIGNLSVSQISYGSLESGLSFKNEYDHNGNPVVQGADGAKRVILGTGLTLEAIIPDGLNFFVTIGRNDLLTQVYPFQWIQGDYNGDGKTDIGIFHVKEPAWYFAVTQGTVPDLLHKVKNGIGGAYEFEYANSTSFDNTGDDGIPHLPMNYKVCVKMTLSDGLGWSTYNKYEYSKGYAFSGFINGKKETDYFGFGEFRAIDALGNKTVSLYNNVPFDDFRMNRALAGAVKETRFIGWDRKEYSRTVNDYMVYVTSPPAPLLGGEVSVASFLVEPIKVDKYLKGIHTEIRTSNIELVPGKYEMKSKSESVTDLYSDGVHTPFTVTGYREFENIESTNEIRLTIKKNLTGTPHETAAFYEYDARGNLTKEILSSTVTGLPSVASLITEHEYDRYGNRTKTTNSSGTPARITEKIFDSGLHQFAVEDRAHTDSGGFGSAQPPYLSTHYVINYGPAFGGISEKADPNGNRTYFDYDQFGRLVSQRADAEKGKETVNTYTYSAEFPMRSKVTVNTGTNDPAIQTSTYTDGLGRIIHTVNSGGDEPGKMLTKTGLVKYDELGRIIRKSQRAWVGDDELDRFKPNDKEKYPSVTEYDGSGRVMRVTLPLAEGETEETSISYSYNDPWEIVESHSVGRNKRTVKNARGQVLYIEDWGSGDNGISASAMIGFAYDSAGNRVKKMDLSPALTPGPSPGIGRGEIWTGMSLEIPVSFFSPGRKDTSGSNITCWRYDAFGRVRESSDPDLGYRKNEYNEFGDLISTTDARGMTTIMAYDRLGRMVLKTLPGTEGTVAYYYDTLAGSENALGKLVRIDDPSQRKDLSYDMLGRIKREVRVITGTSLDFETRFEYDLQNRTKKIYYPKDPETGSALITSYRYGPVGITGIYADTGSGTKNIVVSVKYNEFGQMTDIVRGNGTVTVYDYDIKGRLYGLTTTTGSNNTNRRLQDTRYTFKADNSIKSLENRPDSDANGSNQSFIRYEYTYDGLNRLVHALGSYEKTRLGDNIELENKKFEHDYSYAANGNLTGKTIYDPETHGTNDAWSYAYANHSVTSINTTKYGTKRFQMTYDSAGNMTAQRDNENGLARSMEYDSHNRIRKVTDPYMIEDNISGQYWYDDGGFRVRKIAKTKINNDDARVEVLYPSMYFGMERQLNDKGDVIGNTSYSVYNIYMNGVRIAALMENGKARYYLTDQVDSVKVVVDDYGMAVTRMEYLPYGETWFQENKTGTAEEHNPKYNSQELDRETGYYYYNARHYDAEIGRFVTGDNVIDGEYDTQGWNRYSYVKGNPVAYKDPTGHETLFDQMINDDAGSSSGNTQVHDQIARNYGGDSSTVKANVEGNLQEAKGEKLRPKTPLSQGDPAINKDNNQMAQTGCYFRACQAVAEKKLGKNLTADEINEAKKELQSGKNPAIRSDMKVRDPDIVINDAFKRLGRPDIKATVNWNEQGKKPESSIIEGKTRPNSYHYKTGDSSGKQIWDPAPGTKTNNEKILPVYFHFEND